MTDEKDVNVLTVENDSESRSDKNAVVFESTHGIDQPTEHRFLENISTLRRSLHSANRDQQRHIAENMVEKLTVLHQCGCLNSWIKIELISVQS